MPSVIVTGGFLHSNRKPNALSTDLAALKGANRYAGPPIPEVARAQDPRNAPGSNRSLLVESSMRHTAGRP
jgi:hypothetical protein